MIKTKYYLQKTKYYLNVGGQSPFKVIKYFHDDTFVKIIKICRIYINTL